MHRLTAICVRHPWVTVVVALFLTAVAVRSTLRTGTVVGTDAHLGSEHPAVRDFDDFLSHFGGGYPILIAYECADTSVCDGVFAPAALKMASSVTHRLQEAAFVARVASPATSRLLVSSADYGISARKFVVDGSVVQDPDLVRIALSDPLWSRTLVSSDGRVGAIVVELASTESRALSGVIADVRQAIAPYSTTGFRFHVVGEAVMWVTAQEDAFSTTLRASISTGAMLFVTLLLLLRSVRAVLASLASIGVASAWTIGMLPLFGWQQGTFTSAAATVILVIGCADCVHFVAHYLEEQSRLEGSDSAALVSTSRWVQAPSLLTTTMSAGSFASFASGGVLSLTQLGVLSAIGISLALLLTFTLLPALLVVSPRRSLRRREHSAAWQEVLARLARFGTRRRSLVLLVALSLAVVGGAGIPKLWVELSISQLWGPDDPVMRALEFVNENLQRPDRLEIVLRLPLGSAIEDPTTLDRLVAIEKRVSEVPGIGEVRSLLTLARHVNGLLEIEAPGPVLPESTQALGELMTLISFGDPDSLDGWLTVDHRLARISVETEKLTTAEKVELVRLLDQEIGEVAPKQWQFTITGPVAIAARYAKEFGASQARIISASSFIVFLLVGVYLRSIPWAILAMIPNAVALLLLFGAMGHWGISMDFGSAIVAPIAIGIAADDTIHFLTAYSRQRRSGLDPVAALRRAISDVGEAVITTSLALALGFLSMMTSPFPSIGNIGLLSAIAIVAATLSDLLVLPALIATVASWKGFGDLPQRHE
jgi:hypothetical protein